MSKNKIYYIRRNATAQIPANVLFLDTETKGEPSGDVDVHRMYLAWAWRVTLDTRGSIQRESWRSFTDGGELYQYVSGEARRKAPLCVIGSNITFDLFASCLLEYMEANDWECQSLYDKGLVTILICTKDDRKIKFLAAQNWLQGSVKQWGELVGLEKMEVDLENDTPEKISEYCKRDTEITGRVMLSYMGFVVRHDMGGFSLTAAGQSFRCFRHRFMKKASILHYDDPNFNAYTRAAYFGGRVEAGRIGRLEGSFIKLDINSMYPHVMRHYTYPAKFRQWCRGKTVDYLAEKVRSFCCIAEVEIDTDEPAYAVRRDGKLIFPTGKFTARLCTESIRYALARKHIQKVVQLASFTPARLFEGYVDYFYPLKQQYKEEGNAVWEKTVKIMLNSLYGKFGERRSREVTRERVQDIAVSRVPGLYSRDALEDQYPDFDWWCDASDDNTAELIHGVQWSLLHTRVTEVGIDEGPGSAPAIAAHVTDYARMLLYKYMRLVGLDRILYCDTDSLIIEESDLPKLKGVIDNEALGALKIEGKASTVEIRGAKDYSFGGDLRRKGIRAKATRVCRRCRKEVARSDLRCGQCGDNLRIAAFEQALFPGFYTLLRRGILGGFPIGTVTKTLSARYNKGIVDSAGDVTPIALEE